MTMPRNVKSRRIRVGSATAGILAVSALALVACTGTGNASANNAQAAQNSLSGTIASEFDAAVPYPFAKGAPADPQELRNLSKRLVEYNSASDTNYLYIFTYGGQALGYYVIVGKVSSTGSQMTATQYNVVCSDGSSSSTACTDDSPGDDGSYGPEEGGNMGVFFYTSIGTLVETDQPFLVSSSPIKIYANVPQLDAPAK